MHDSLRAKITESHLTALMSDPERQQHEQLKSEIAELEKRKPQPYPTARANRCCTT